MEFYGLLIKLVLLANFRSTFCAESNGQKAHFQVEDKSGDLKVTATKDQAKVTAQADSVQVVVNPGTADYPVVKSDKPVVHVSGPMCCNGGWSTYSARKKSAVLSTKNSKITWKSRHEKTPATKKAHAPTSQENNNNNKNNNLVLQHKISPAKASLQKTKGRDSERHKNIRKVSTANIVQAKSHRQRNPTLVGKVSDSKNVVSRRGKTPLKDKLGRLVLPFTSKSLKQKFLHESKMQELPGTKKTEVKGPGPSFHVTGNAGKLKMHVTKDATELTSESGGVDVLLKPPTSGSSDKADAQARSKQVIHLATELGGNFEGLGVKKSILSHVGQIKE